MMAEVQRGYEVTSSMLAKGEERFPDDWKLRLVKAGLMLDEANLHNLENKESSFTKEREKAFAVFADAAVLYAKALPSMEQKDQSADVYLHGSTPALARPISKGSRQNRPHPPSKWH